MTITEKETPLLTHPTSDRPETLGFTGKARALYDPRRAGTAFENLSFEERPGLLADREATERETKRLATRIGFAALRHAACVEDIGMRSPRGIGISVIAHLIDGGWIDRHENLLITLPITGPAGPGKSWIACALGPKACRDDRRVIYSLTTCFWVCCQAVTY